METSLWLQRQLNEITFEHRNKNYGAFPLRQEYHHTMAKSMLLSIGFFILFFAGFCFYLSKFSNLPDIAEQITETVVWLNPAYEVEKPKFKPIPKTPRQVAHTNTPSLPTRVVIDETPVKTVEAPLAIEVSPIDESTSAIGSENIIDPGPGPDVTQDIAGNDVIEANTSVPIYLVDQKPEFPGGDEAMYKYLRKNLSYPQLARDARLSGTVIVQFMVNATGEIENVTVVRTPSSLFNSISTETIKKMPNWKPGIYKGKAVPVIFTLPLKFELL